MPSPMLSLTASLPRQKKLHRKAMRRLARLEANTRREALGQVGAKLSECTDASTSQGQCLEFWRETIESTQQVLASQRQEACEIVRSFRARAEAMESRRMEKEDARSRDAEIYFETAASKLSATVSDALLFRDDEQRTKTKDTKPKRKKLRKSATGKGGTKKINLSKRPVVSSELVAHVVDTTTEIEQCSSNQDLTQHQHHDSQHREYLESVQEKFVEKDEEDKERITETGDTECEKTESVIHETKELFMMRDEECTGETIRIWRQREVECALTLAREDVESQYADKVFRREVAIAIDESKNMSNEDAWSASQYREAWRRIDDQQREASERASMLQADSARRHEEMAEKLIEWEQLCLGKRQRALVRVSERLDAHLRQSYDVDLYEVEDVMIGSKDTTKHRSTWTDLRVEFRLGFETLRGPSAVFKSQSGNVPPVLEIIVSHAEHGVLGVSFYDMTRLKRRHAGTEKLWLPLRPRRDEATGLPIGVAVAGEQWLEREKTLAPASKAYANRLRLQHSVAQTRTIYRLRLGGIENDQAVPPASFAGHTIRFQRTGPNEYTSEFLGPKRLCYYHDLRLGNIVIFGDEVWRLASYILPGGIRGDFYGCESKAPVDPMERLHAEKVKGFLKMRAVILMQRQVRRFRARNERRFRDALRYGTAMEGWILHADVELQQCFFAHELLPGQVTWAPEDGEEFDAHLKRVEKARKARLEAALCSVIEVLPREKQYEQIARVLDEGVASRCGQDAKHRPDHARMLAILEKAPLDNFAAQLSIACINWEFYEESGLAGKSYLQRALRAVKAVLMIARPWSDWTPRQFSTATRILLASGNRRAARAQLRSFVAFANDLGCDHPDFARRDKFPECAAEIEDTNFDHLLKKTKSQQRQGKTTSRSTTVQIASVNAPTMSKTKTQRKKGDKPRRGKKRSRGESKEPKQDRSVATTDETSGEQGGPLAALPWPIIENLAGLELCADHAARARHVLYQLLEQNIVQREPHCAREAEYLFAVAMCFTDPDAEMARESRDAAFRAAVKADPSVKTQWLTSSVWWEDAKPWALAGVRFASRGALGFAVTALEIAMDRGGVLEFTELDALGRAAFAFGRPRLAQLAADEALATSRFEGEEQHAVRAIQLHAKYSQIGSQWRRCAILCCGVAHGKQRARQRYLHLLHKGAVASNRERQAAAKMLQKIVRARRDRKIVARLRRQQCGAAALRARVLARIRQLRLSTAFSTWHLTSTQRRGVREMCTRRLRGLVFSCWRSWMFYHEEMRALKIASAMRIQRQRRAYLLRRLIDRRVQQTRAERARLAFLERCFLERQAASTIQRCVRGYFAKLRHQRRPEVLLQARIRGRIWRKRYRRTKQAAISVQAWWRGCRTRFRARPQFQEHFLELAMAFAAGETATNGRGSVAAAAGGTMSGDKASIAKGRERSRLRLGAAKQIPRSRRRGRRKGDPASHYDDDDDKIREESVRLPPIGSLMAPSAQLKAAYVLRCKTRRKT